MTTDLPAIEPQRANVAGIGIIVGDALLLSIISFSAAVGFWAVIASLILVSASLLVRDLPSLHLALLTSALVAVPCLFPSLQAWPYKLLIPLLAYLAVILPVRRFRRSILWLRAGRITVRTAFLTLAVSTISVAALYLWHRVLSPDLNQHLVHFPDMPFWMLPLAGLAFAIGNAALEEVVFRGIVMQALDSAAGRGMVSLLGQAWLFGAMHFLQGFPNGEAGTAMTFVYGAMLGGLRRKSRGMLAPWISHAVADFFIFVVLAAIVVKKNGAI